MGMFDKLFNTSAPQLLEDWKILNDTAQIEEIKKQSFNKPVVIFKHSISCGISGLAKHNLEKDWNFDTTSLDFYYLDLLSHRPVSNLVAEAFDVVHQSPQILVIKDGKSVFDTSHHLVNVESIEKALS